METNITIKHPFSFSREERLKSQKAIDELFSGTNPSYTSFPLKVILRKVEDSPTTQILVSVSKRHFKRAVMRNRIKRQIRECYRLEKHLLPDSEHYHLAFLWLCNKELPTAEIRQRMVKLLSKIHA